MRVLCEISHTVLYSDLISFGILAISGDFEASVSCTEPLAAISSCLSPSVHKPASIRSLRRNLLTT
jgi:hypothetical protein